MLKKFNKKSKNGFTLVEVLVSLAGITIVMLGVYGLSSFALKITTNNKFIVSATSLANRKMEQVRNLPYKDIGTISGIPTGIIADNEIISDRSGKFDINTFIQYIDDSFDGISGSTTNDDLLPTDYKTIRIRVSWDGPFGVDNVEAFSQIAPKGMETNAGGGILSILVFDASGVPIENADIHIENNILATPISIDAQTNAYGRLDFPGATSSIEGYEILATKIGYSTSSTSPRTIENPNPTIPHITVIEGFRTEISFTIDILCNLIIKTVTADLPSNWVVADSDEIDHNQENSRIAFDSAGNVYIVWQDDRDGSDPNIYAQKYDDNGNSIWTDDERISTANGTIVPDILVDNNGNLYISWNNNSVGNKEAYLVKRDSSDGSDLWGAGKNINTLADAYNQSHPLITLTKNGSNATTTVIWQDDRNSDVDIYLQVFNSDGDYQLSPEVRVNSNPISDGTNQYNADIESDNNENIIVAWTDDRGTNLDIYAELFSSTTISQWEKILVSEASADQYSPSIAVDSSNNFYVTWTDERDGDKNIYIQKFDTDGNSIWASEIKINTDGGSSDQYSPSIAIDGLDNIYITWTDTRNTNMDIYAQKMLTDGTISWADDIRVNIDTTNSNQYNSQVVINPTNNVPFVTWQSNIEGDENIYVSSFGVYTNEQNFPNINIIVTGQKRIGELPIIYKYNKIYTSDGIGDIFLNNIEWDSYSFEATSTTYSIILSEPSIPINLEPNTTASIKLYLDN